MTSCNVIDSIALNVEPSAMADELLVAAAQVGREWAFTELCKRNSKRVFSTVYRETRNREDAEDALQDATMRVFLHLDKFDGRSSFATWFTRIGINSALMILRKKRVRSEISMDSSTGGESREALQIADYSSDPEEFYSRRERSQHLKRAICALPEALRSVVEKGHLQEYSMRQIAGVMGISIPATKSRLARAKILLRKSMVSAQQRGDCGEVMASS
jgi:RNA polymerase sigma-70 factor (ECF subfamily)